MGETATEPEKLSQFILTRLNAGDVEGVVALYEPTAALVLPDGSVANGTEQIRAFYARLLAGRPTFAQGQPRQTLVNGDLALTSTRLATGPVTVELARRQPDGTWLWVMDNPNFAPASPAGE
ncbi:MAG TPA: nuclear transport factor 2 family protein [Pseudonocardiaceae bacterium]|nr:nuclear transport factor 2 family protein [Pseudonocardiaceae bacterium]